MENGRRTWTCELSTIDTGLLLLGMLAAAEYFSGDHAAEREIRERVDTALPSSGLELGRNGALTLSHGYKPRGGFLKYRWQGYSEGLVLYLLGLGSPSHPLTPRNYHAWTHTYQWQKIYDREFLYAGPLFIHQFLHVWCDFRGLKDDSMKKKSWIILRTAAAPRIFNTSIAAKIRWVSRDIPMSIGESRPAMVPVPQRGKLSVAAKLFMVIVRAACLLARTMEPFRRGRRSRRCPLRRKLSCRLLSIFTKLKLTSAHIMALSPRSTFVSRLIA